MEFRKKVNRRRFIGSAAAASAGFTIVPDYVLGRNGKTAPSDKLTIGYIGCGTQGLREMTSLIADPAVQIVSVCDPNKFTTDYVDWSLNGIRNSIAKALGEPSWGQNMKGIPGGRDIGQEFVNKYYARQKNLSSWKGCSSYADFRELLEKEKDVSTIKIMTPDHLHAAIAIASLKKGMNVITHKPIANRIHESKKLIETARQSAMETHLLAWSRRPEYEAMKKLIAEGALGTLREIHNWSNRPVWPQWQSEPADRPPVPEGFDWQLWLGPVPDRPYHPNYTHAVFRGWYDFGGGSIADMGHYSLFPLFRTLGIESPALSAEACGTTTCTIKDHVSTGVRNDAAFPLSCIIRFQFGPQITLPPFELFWYDGGMKPATPDELQRENSSLATEGLMLVGEKGKIIAGFRGENPVLYSGWKKEAVKVAADDQPSRGNELWIDPFRNKTRSPGSFIFAGPVTETILLGAVALRARRKVNYDSAAMKITGFSEADKYLTREYRKGWEI